LAGLADQEQRSRDFNRHLRNTALILLLLAAFALRLYRLDHQEIWGDEAHSAYVASLPPPYHLLLWFWVKLTGSSVFALRFLSPFQVYY